MTPNEQALAALVAVMLRVNGDLLAMAREGTRLVREGNEALAEAARNTDRAVTLAEQSNATARRLDAMLAAALDQRDALAAELARVRAGGGA